MPLTRPTTTPMPDEIFDEWAPQLGEAEIKVLLYIVRRTLGFRKEADAISLTQFHSGITTHDGRQLDKGCGVKSRRTIVVALKNLEALGLIRTVRAQAAAGDRDTSVYALWWAEDAGGSVPGLPPSSPKTPRWCPENTGVVAGGHYGSVPRTPTTNSPPTNSQQNSKTTRARTPARKLLASERDDGTTDPSKEPAALLWQAVLEDVREVITAANFDAWLAPTRALSLDENLLRVAVTSPLQQQWLATRLRRHVERALQALGQDTIRVAFVEDA